MSDELRQAEVKEALDRLSKFMTVEEEKAKQTLRQLVGMLDKGTLWYSPLDGMWEQRYTTTDGGITLHFKITTYSSKNV